MSGFFKKGVEMAEMDELFDNETLDKIGKVLVLSIGHNLKYGDIKRLTMAETVRKIRRTKNPNIERFVTEVVSKAMDVIESCPGREDIYLISCSSCDLI